MEIWKLVIGIMFVASGCSVILRIIKLQKKFQDLSGDLPAGEYYSFGICLIVVGLFILFT